MVYLCVCRELPVATDWSYLCVCVCIHSQAIEINFDSDSIIKQYVDNSSVFDTKKTCDSATSFNSPTSPVGQWVFDNKLQDSLPGFQLTQLCSCYRYSQKKGKDGSKRKPITVSTLQYSVDIGL